MATVREAVAELRADGARLPGDLARAESQFARAGRKFGRRVGRGLSRGIRGAFGKLKSLAGGLGIGGALGFGVGLQEALAFEKQIENVAVQTEFTAGETDNLRKTVMGLSNELGISRTEIASGVETLGDLIGATGVTTEQVTTLARAMKASNGDAAVLGRLMQVLQKQFGLTGREAEAALSSILSIGKQGSIPLAKMAESAPSLVAVAKSAGIGANQLGLLVATTQELEGVFGDANAAANALEGVFGNLANRERQIRKAFKVNVFEKAADGTIKQRNAFEVLSEILPKVAKDARLVTKGFGARKEVGQAIRALADPKIQRRISDLARAGKDLDKVQEDLDRRALSPATKMEKGLNRVKLAVAKAFTPERIEKFAAAADGAADAVSAVGSAISEMYDRWNEGAAGLDPQANAIDAARKQGLSDAEIARRGLAGTGAQQAEAMKRMGVSSTVRSALSHFRIGPLAEEDRNALNWVRGTQVAPGQRELVAERQSVVDQRGRALRSTRQSELDRVNLADLERAVERGMTRSLEKKPIRTTSADRPRRPVVGTRPAP